MKVRAIPAVLGIGVFGYTVLNSARLPEGAVYTNGIPGHFAVWLLASLVVVGSVWLAVWVLDRRHEADGDER